MSSKGKKTKQKVEDRPQVTAMEDDTPQQSLERFEEELLWCIDQLQLGLESQNPSSKQAAEASKVLKILLSSKAPMIKKRQVMRNTFGDYRKKMAEEEKKSETAVRKAKISAMPSSGAKKSTFYKKSVHKSELSNIAGGDQSQETRDIRLLNEGPAAGDSGVTTKGNNELLCVCKEDTKLTSDFQFNFKINDDNCTETLVDQSEKQEHISGKETVGSNQVSNVCKMGDNNFKFNFEINDQS